MTPPLKLEEAQARLLALVEPVDCERVPVEQSLGRTLAEPVIAARTQPPADLSAMDGYALLGEGPWQVIGESRAGHPFDRVVSVGEAVRISTGALMPEGADTVLLQEDAERSGETLRVSGGSPIAGRHIRRAGFDFRSGDEVLGSGVAMNPARIALALSAGLSQVTVRRKPRIVIIDSGDELASNPDQCAPHQIPASNGAMLAAMASSVACDISRIGPVADDLGALNAAFEQCANADIVVTSGGASVGDHDLIRPALESVGAEIDFWRVAIKPGKPLLVAKRGKQVVLGLPGNPVSSFVTGFFFMLPLLRAASGRSMACPTPLSLPLAMDMPSGGERREFVRATMANGQVSQSIQTDSSALGSLACATALIDRPAGADEAKAGTFVPVYLLENGGIA